MFEPSQEPGEFYPAVGVGPHPLPWPVGDEFDPEFLEQGDRRNILEKYRYWKTEAIKADLQKTRARVEVAIENWQHDLNIGSLVRTSNALNVRRFHIIGKKHWNQHGALMTDKYLDVLHHPTIEEFLEYVKRNEFPLICFENNTVSQPLETFIFPKDPVLAFGNEGLGMSDELLSAANEVVHISQFGSVRSINASAAGAIALFEWQRQNYSQ
ncbi:MAG: hypothetical protein RIS09_641 [Actinomycetota bacterium]|jgi:tRNA G18 (ribose-2'-O)-methylase SpoU